MRKNHFAVRGGRCFPGGRWRAWLLAMFATLMVGGPAQAAIPDALEPLVVEAPFSVTGRVFDLTDAFQRAAVENKPVFIYLGAKDCSSCAAYSNFLELNASLLKPSFERLVVVDIRTRMGGLPMVFKIGEKRYSFEAFKRLVGDQNKFLTFPYFWLVGPDLKQLRQLPMGAFEETRVERHIELMRVP